MGSSSRVAGPGPGPGRSRATQRALVEHALTIREFEVIQHVVRGATSARIGASLGISVRTVHKHLENAYRKLGVSNRTAAAMRLIGPQAPGVPDARGVAQGANEPPALPRAGPVRGNSR